jgi:hypothetical protein
MATHIVRHGACTGHGPLAALPRRLRRSTNADKLNASSTFQRSAAHIRQPVEDSAEGLSRNASGVTMSRLLALFTALCLSIPAHAASSTFNSANGELTITEIGLAGENTRYRDVTLKLVGLTAVYLNDPRVTTFSLDPATAVLHLPTLIYEGRAYAGARIEGARLEIVRVGSWTEGSAQAFPGA